MTELITTTYGFPRTKRLLTAGDFRTVFDRATVKAGTAELFLLATPATEFTTPRIGFIISRKNVRRAVARNRIKRIVREQFRHLPKDYPSFDIIVMARKGADRLEPKTLHSTVSYLFNKLNKRIKAAPKHSSASQ
ncbi:ribonuclease P protein component [Salinispirillum marinum]|uniref:Ribonuclease P protein component n=2 Tax=Saccharospirillaceae TaxID=255527 RepID=A0ABV8BEJ5_9GAMM